MNKKFHAYDMIKMIWVSKIDLEFILIPVQTDSAEDPC